MKLTVFICCLVFCTACRETKDSVRFPVFAVVPSEQAETPAAAPVYIGGYGSSMAYNEKDSTFWILTDRGPNVNGQTPESKVFPLPDYAPQVGVFKLKRDSLVVIRKILLCDTNGLLFTGLPNMEGDGKTGETAYDCNGQIIRNERQRGLDPEGLALAPDGTFWVSDEYGPYILHFNAGGELLEEFSPFNGKLPAYYAHRQPNRGMEGLSINKAGNILYGIMQSPLNQPDGTTSIHPTLLRIIALNLADCSHQEFAYLLENPKNVVSEINYVNDTTFLVLERDNQFPQNGKGFKRIYQIRTTQATDISDLPQPEQYISATNRIRPVEKSLFCNILEAIPAYPHDKPEGIALIGEDVLCIVNDDDFGITAPEQADGSVVPKLRNDNLNDRNEIYFIRLR